MGEDVSQLHCNARQCPSDLRPQGVNAMSDADKIAFPTETDGNSQHGNGPLHVCRRERGPYTFNSQKWRQTGIGALSRELQ